MSESQPDVEQPHSDSKQDLSQALKQLGDRRRHDAVQFNTRLSAEHRAMLEAVVAAHPRRRASLRDVIEELIEAEYSRLHRQTGRE